MSGGGSPGRLMGGPGGETGGGGSLSSFSPCSRSSVRGPCSAASTCRRRGKRGVKVNAVFMSPVCFINKKNWLESIACRLSGYLDTCSCKFVSSGEISFTPTRHTWCGGREFCAGLRPRIFLFLFVCLFHNTGLHAGLCSGNMKQ